MSYPATLPRVWDFMRPGRNKMELVLMSAEPVKNGQTGYLLDYFEVSAHGKDPYTLHVSSRAHCLTLTSPELAYREVVASARHEPDLLAEIEEVWRAFHAAPECPAHDDAMEVSE